MSIEAEVKNILHNYLAKARGAYSVGVLADACYDEIKKHLKVKDIPVVDERKVGKVLSDGTASEVSDG
ncbi:hypothetical protein LCGC14_1462000 [marine sediment metagenome]|uniref:Uncharacterized protein n=1 Tax=marine sediment metagenome TaxID=412755 RepID=A0A0F9K0X7_9ZZZZ